MSESFDSWQGFMDAGFVEEEQGRLRLGDSRASYFVQKCEGTISVHFVSAVPGYESVEFDLPVSFGDMWKWAATIALRTFGSEENGVRFLEKLGENPDRDLLMLVDFGLKHIDEISMNAEAFTAGGEVAQDDGEPEKADGDEGAPVVEGGESGEEGVFDTLRVVLSNALEREWKDLETAAQLKDSEQSKCVMARMERLKALEAKIADVASEWHDLDLEVPPCFNSDADEESDAIPEVHVGDDAEEDSAAEEEIEETSEEDEEMSKPGKPKPRSHCTGFAVTFEDGARIAESKASTTFAKVIEKIGAERVAALDIKMAGDPIVTQNREDIRKMPMMVQPIAGGWFVKTHSNTYTKIEFLKRIAESLGATMKFEVFMREGTVHVKPKRPRGRPCKAARKEKSEFQIGRVVKWYFPILFKNNAVADDEITLFLSDESKRRFGTRGFPVLKESTGAADDYIINGNRRYYSDIRLPHNGHTYLLTSQFITANSEAILKWLEGKGCAREEMDRIGRGEETVPSLFDNLTLFQKDEIVLAERAKTKSENSVANAPDKEKEAVAEKNADILVRTRDGGVLASTVKKSLKEEMERLMYTRRSLAAGLNISPKVVKWWCKGIGTISAEQYDALCKHMAIKGLKQRGV